MKIKHKQVHPLKFIKSPKALIYNGLLFVIILASLGCSSDGRMTTFESFGPVAEVQGLLFDVLIWVMAIVFVLVEFVLIYAAIKYRHKPGPLCQSKLMGIPH